MDFTKTVAERVFSPEKVGDGVSPVSLPQYTHA